MYYKDVLFLSTDEVHPKVDGGHTVIGHSLSWSRNKPEVGGRPKMSAKLWVPASATEADLVNLSSSSQVLGNSYSPLSR